MSLEVRARIGEQREAARMALGEAVERERRDRVDDLLGGLAFDPLAGHPRAQLDLALLHAPLAALEAEGAAQLLGLAPAEAGRHHRHAQELLLEERHPERAPEDRLETRVRVRYGLAPPAPAHIGVHHVADD